MSTWPTRSALPLWRHRALTTLAKRLCDDQGIHWHWPKDWERSAPPDVRGVVDKVRPFVTFPFVVIWLNCIRRAGLPYGSEAAEDMLLYLHSNTK